jgi:triosephosphate isomerase
MRKKIAAGNWKMNTTFDEASSLIDNILSGKRDGKSITILGVPFVYLSSMVYVTSSTNDVFVAAQNVHHKESGAYTGEISATMLKSIGIEYVIVGHSERREYFAESNQLIKEKVDILLSHNMSPIFCCGESLDIRKSGAHLTFVENQITESLFHLTAEELSEVIIAYEPIWAIGTGETASPEQAQEMQHNIRKHFAAKYGDNVANNLSILYGGSVKANNAKELFSQPDVDGGLVGGASLDADGFLSIINSF